MATRRRTAKPASSESPASPQTPDARVPASPRSPRGLDPRRLKALGPGDYTDRVVRGLVFRVRSTDKQRTRRWAIRYRTREGDRRGPQRRLHFGELDGSVSLDLAALGLADFDVPRLSGVEEARTVARALLGLAARGVDPLERLAEVTERQEAAEAEAARRKAEGTLTLGMLVDRMIEARESKLRPATVASWRGLARTWLGLIRDADPSALTARDVRRWHKAIGATGKTVTANRALELVSVTFSWAMEEEDETGEPLLSATPCANVKPFEEKPRERVLSSDELRRVWLALEAEPHGDAVRLLLWTGVRLREALHAEWGEFDLPARLWTIPAERSKTGATRRVPLCSSALAALQARRKAHPKGRWCFPSPVAAVGPLRGLQSVLRSVQARSETSGWTAHDLRRTVRTGLGALGVSPTVAEFILGHLPPRLVRTYNRHEPLAEAASALEAWDRRLAAIVSGEEPESTVVPFARA